MRGNGGRLGDGVIISIFNISHRTERRDKETEREKGSGKGEKKEKSVLPLTDIRGKISEREFPF